MSSVEVSLNDKTLFDLSIGKRLLRKDYIEASGRIPAYSSNVFSPFVYTSYSNVEDFSIPYVLWGIDGTFEFNVMPIGEKFAYTDHCGVIKIKNPKINPYYLAYTLEENKHKYGFDRGLRASLSNMKSVKVSIPVDDSGEFDESAQSGIADSMLGMRQIRESLSEKKAEIKRVKIFIDDENFLFRYIPIEEIFDLVRGNGKYTKSYVQNHKGEYPLYSGNTYVDDILILCNSSEAGEIKNFCVETLKTDYILDANEKKTMFGEIVNGVPFLGYMFFDSKVGIRPSAEEKLEDSIEELFRLRKKQTISPQVFIWRLNLRITGCILDSKKYGWLFYYSQLTDLSILFHLDWFVGHLFSRYGFDRPKDIKRFIRSYHEITKNISRSSYIINADRYSFEEKAEILSEIYNQRNFNKNDALTVDSLFKATMFKEVQRLEYDIQNFS